MSKLGEPLIRITDGLMFLYRATPFCQRCRQLGVQCEGYGIRLNWIHETGHDDDGQKDHEAQESRTPRRSLTYVGVSAVPRISSSELDATLSQIDEWSPSNGQSCRLEQGGFSVFSSDAVSKVVERADLSATPSFSYRELSPTHTADEAVNHADDLSATLQGDSSDARQTYTQIESSDSLPIAETLLRLGWESDTGHQADQAQKSDHVQRSHTTVVGTVQTQLNQQYGYKPPRHLDVLTIPAGQKRLIHHWVTFTSRKLALLDEPHNPCRTMMLPMALKGLVSSSEGSNADIAIFHALCASAAWNLYELGGRTREQDSALALNHDQQAIHHLRHNLARADEHRDQSCAMAIMACIAVEAISGTTQRWRTHVSGGLAYLAKLHSRGVDEVVLSPFQRHMVSMAILCDVPVPDNLKSFLNDERVEGLEFTFPYYGVSRSFLLNHDRMNTFAAAIATSANKTAELEKELDAFELQLYLDFPGIPPQGPGSSGLVIHHVAKAFYYAGLVFFQRSIRRAAIDTVQTLVELGVSELEALERVGNGELGCMMVWPVLALGAECDTPRLQMRMRAWFREHQKRLGFRNLVVLQDLVDAVWRARVGGATVVDWRDFIAMAEFDVFRL